MALPADAIFVAETSVVKRVQETVTHLAQATYRRRSFWSEPVLPHSQESEGGYLLARARPGKLPVWRNFQACGLVEIHSLHLRKFGRALPRTCKGATLNDSFLINAPLVSLPRSWNSTCRRRGSPARHGGGQKANGPSASSRTWPLCVSTRKTLCAEEGVGPEPRTKSHNQ